MTHNTVREENTASAAAFSLVFMSMSLFIPFDYAVSVSGAFWMSSVPSPGWERSWSKSRLQDTGVDILVETAPAEPYLI